MKSVQVRRQQPVILSQQRDGTYNDPMIIYLTRSLPGVFILLAQVLQHRRYFPYLEIITKLDVGDGQWRLYNSCESSTRELQASCRMVPSLHLESCAMLETYLGTHICTLPPVKL